MDHLQTRPKKGNSCLEKPAIDVLDSSLMKKTAANSKTKGDKKTLDPHAIFVINSCQGKDAGIVFRLNYSIINTLALAVIQVLDGRTISTLLGKHSSLHAYCSSLSLSL